MQSRVKFKIKSVVFYELLTPEAIKLLGSAEGKITEDKYSGNVTKLGITDGVHCNIVNNQFQKSHLASY